MRNVHLGLGLVFVLMSLVFAVSSLVIIYRSWLDTDPQVSEIEVRVSPEAAASPRAAARELMAGHGLAGDLLQIREEDGAVRFRIVRPGDVAEVEYAPATGAGTIKITRQGALETLVRLHTNHGLWHEYLPSQLWALISLLASAGLLLLGATGIYLWFIHHDERVVGGVLLGVGLVFGFVTLILTRLEQ